MLFVVRRHRQVVLEEVVRIAVRLLLLAQLGVVLPAGLAYRAPRAPVLDHRDQKPNATRPARDACNALDGKRLWWNIIILRGSMSEHVR